MKLGFTRRSVLATVATAVLALALGSALAVAAQFDPDQPTVTEVGPVTKSSISVFRQTDPVVVPQIVKDMATADPKSNGTTFFGMNSALARPAYPDAAHKLPPVWLIPGADEFLMTFTPSIDGKTGGGGGGPVDNDYFQKFGAVVMQGGSRGSNKRSLVTVLVPDSITLVKIKTKPHGKKGHIHRFTPHDNVVVANLKHTVAVIVGGKKIEVGPRRRPRE